MYTLTHSKPQPENPYRESSRVSGYRDRGLRVWGCMCIGVYILVYICIYLDVYMQVLGFRAFCCVTARFHNTDFLLLLFFGCACAGIHPR